MKNTQFAKKLIVQTLAKMVNPQKLVPQNTSFLYFIRKNKFCIN